MMRSVVLLTGNHLCHNPRALKEADTLAEAGHAVQILGAWTDRELAVRDRTLMETRRWTFTPAIDLTGRRTTARSLWVRLRSWLGRKAAAGLGLENHWQLGYCAPELLRAARKSGAALFIAHSEQALWVCGRLLDTGHRVGVDMEDWFSEDLPPAARKGRAVNLLQTLERRLLNEGRHCTCPSRAMSLALAAEYGCRPPLVIYNAFAASDRAAIDGQIRDRRNRNVPSIHWYSQTIGPGRGLEDLFTALAHIDAEVEVHLRGRLAQGADQWLAQMLRPEWQDRIFVHALATNSELLSRIAEHDIGIAAERDDCRSRDLTVTNKVLQYLLAGLAVVASDTAGQREIAARAPGAVHLYPRGDARALGHLINRLLGDPAQLASAKQSAVAAASQTFHWERFAPELVRSVRAALA